MLKFKGNSVKIFDNNKTYFRSERNSGVMSVRCAVCGSKNVVKEFKQEGYDVKKGVIGTVLVGAPGALAGAGGKEVTYYHCADCGQVMNRPMFDNESSFIDDLIANPTMFPTTLREKKSQYKNIEWEENEIDVEENICSQSEKDIEEWKNEITRMLEKNPYIKCSELYRLDENMKSLNACTELEKSGRIVADIINNESYYRLVTDKAEMRELIFKADIQEKIKQKVDGNFETYRKMLYDRLAFDKSYTQGEYEALIRDVYASEFDFEEPYVFGGFMSAFDIRMLKLHFKILSKEGYLFKSDDQIFAEQEQECAEEEMELQERSRKENMSDEDVSQVILDFLSEQQDYFTASELVKNENELSECTMKRIIPILKNLEKAGYIKVKEEDKRKYYAIVKAGINLQEEAKKRIEEEKKREEQRRIQCEIINKKIKDEEEKYNAELELLQKHLNEQTEIFEANKSKIFGEGAKLKKEAKQQIEIFTNQIANLKEEYLSKKSLLQAELQKL